MPYSEIKGKVVPIKLWANPTEVESQVIDQLRNIAALPWVVHHVAVMPDCHLGKGATVGSVVVMKNAVSPAAVGVDIGCGLGAIRTNLTSARIRNLKKLRERIEELIPVGFAGRSEVHPTAKTDLLFNEFKNLDERVQRLADKALYQCGTLGSGNHFISLNVDTDDRVWLMLHSGSRNIGKELAEIHISVASKLDHNRMLPDRALAVFLANTPEMLSYRRDLYWCQRYAFLNRQIMLEVYKEILLEFWPGVVFDEPILCHHNYVSEEVHFGDEVFVTRKGAISAKAGELGVIPGAMGQKNYIVRGVGNPDSFHSASHGAGRRMSRSKAKAKYTVEDLREQTSGVECRKDKGVLDEIPSAYKNLDKVMAQQSDLVEIVAELKEVLTVKG